MSQVDLHLHSTASDGQYTPTELVRLALEGGLQVIALTDHDTTEGIEEALSAAYGTDLRVIPGVEISTDVPGNHEVHILGYYIDPSYVPLQEALAKLRESRVERMHKVLALLAQAGCPVSLEQVSALAGEGAVGRPHIAQAMVEANYVSSVESAFRFHLGRGAPAYVPRPKLSPQRAIQLVLEAGGVPVLAHPGHVIEHIPSLARAGLVGLEVFYVGYPKAEQDFLIGLAQKHNLIVTGGSDFHGAGIAGADQPGQVEVPWSTVEQLRANARHGAYHAART